MSRVVLLICTFLILQIGVSFAQDYRIDNITSEYIRIDKGLSQNTVNTILQDQEGYIWAGTWSGLNRFDGYSFKTFSINMVEPSQGLTNATITGLAEDDFGYIWASCPKGLNRVSKKDFSITQFTVEESINDGMISDSIKTLFRSKNGSIWIGTNNGILVLDPQSLKFKYIEHNPRDFTTISSNQITCFAEDSAGTIWVGTTFGLNKLNPATHEVVRFYGDAKPGHLLTPIITALNIDRSGKLWVGTPFGLHLFNASSNTFSHFPIEPAIRVDALSSRNIINCIYADNENNIWIGTPESGLLRFDPTRNQFENMQQQIPESEYFSYTAFWSIIQDNNGIFWLGTSHKGLVKLVPESHAFYEISKSYSTFGIIEPKPGMLWCGTQDGVMLWDRIKKKTDRFIRHSSDPNSISSNHITDLFNDPPYVWIGSNNGLNQYNSINRTNKRFLPDNSGNSIAGNIVWHISKDSRGNYWFATDNGISRYNSDTGVFTNYRHDPDNPNSLSNNFCVDIFERAPGIFMIATQYGLNEFNETTGQWKNYLPIPGNPNSIGATYAFGVFKDSHGLLWAFTNGGGFSTFDPESGTFNRYTIEDGLSDNIVYGIYEDRAGIFWLTTNDGLSRFDPVNEEFTNFDVQDGLLSNEFNKNSIYEARDGEVFVGGVNGIVAFFPRKAPDPLSIPVARITGIVVHGTQKQYEYPVSDTIRIPSSDNTFSISFSVMDYLNPFKNQFSYFLENSDKDKTQLPPGMHQVDYRNVVPGHYTFRITGTNSMGIRSNEVVTTIIIVPAWNETKAFKYISILLVLIISSTIVLLVLRSTHNKHEMEKRLLTIRNELIRSQKFALRSQMNPHFIFNSLNSIQNFVLKNDADSANYYLSNFSVMMRKVLEYSQYNYITLFEELELIRLYLKMEHMRFSKKFEIEIKVDPKIDQHLVRIPPMFLQPYLENAILHGLQLIKHKGLLQVLITDHEDYMKINIVDNGVGRARAKAIQERSGHKSRGLANIEKRIQLYNSMGTSKLHVNIFDIMNDQNEPAGTRVEITVPYEMEDHPEEIL